MGSWRFQLARAVVRRVVTTRLGATLTGLALMATVSVAQAGPAGACGLSSHCYGSAFGSASGIVGNAVDISPSCLSTPSGNFVTDELWLVSSGASAWVEVGFLQEGSGLNIGGITSAGRYGFWADNRPGGGFHAHVLVTNPPLAYTYMDIEKTATNTYIAKFGTHTGTSTSNSMTPSYGQWGSETTSASSKSYSFNRYVVYLHGSIWSVGVPNATTTANTPEKFSWISKPQAYNAGITC